MEANMRFTFGSHLRSSKTLAQPADWPQPAQKVWLAGQPGTLLNRGNMKKIESFSLEKHEGTYELWPRRTRLFFDGVDTGTKIPGFIIEAQYKCDEGYLLITSQDCPFEESNVFILLTPSFHSIAYKGLCVAYESFLLDAHWPISESAIRLHYYENVFMTLSIHKSWSIFGRKNKLVLERFQSSEDDPQATAALNDLKQRLEEKSDGST